MKFERIENGFVRRDDNGNIIAEITYALTGDENVVVANHTYVSPVLRGQGVAEKLLDHLVAEMDKEGKKIKAHCSYVVTKFENDSDKYDFINAEKN